MKKLLTALLVVAMMLSLCSVAFAADFSDTKDLSKDVQGSIAKLNALNVINGYPDGTFKPANTITRAEFSKITAILAGMESSAKVLQTSPSKFTDVAAGQWYTGYINLAAAQGFVKGYPDGTFRPNATITYAEVVTVILRTLGYNDNLPGPWPVDYIAKAANLDITEDITFDANAPATRGDVAVMSDAALDCDVVSWDSDKEKFVNEGYTLLDDSFKGAVVDDVYVKSWSYDADDEEFTITFDKIDFSADFKDMTKALVGQGAQIKGAALVKDLNSKYCDIIWNGDDEEIIFIEVTSTSVTAKESDIDPDGDEIEVLDVTYDVVSGYNLPTLYAGIYYTVYMNEDEEVYLVSPNGKLNVAGDALLAQQVIPYIVSEYDKEDEILIAKNDGEREFDLDGEDVLVAKGGKWVALTDLEENDIVYVNENTNGVDYYLDVRSWKEGEFAQSYKTGGAYSDVKIAGTKYAISGDGVISRDDGEDFDDTFNDDGLDNLEGETVKYFLNKAYQATFIMCDVDASASENMYGIVIDNTDKAVRLAGGGTDWINGDLTILLANGTKVTYDIGADAKTASETAFEDTAVINDFVKFVLDEDGDIDKFEILHSEGAVWATITEVDEKRGLVLVGGTWYEMTDKTVVFNIYPNIKDSDDDAVVEKNSVVDEDVEGLKVFVEANSDNDIKYLVFKEKLSSTGDDDYCLVTDQYYRSGDLWVAIDVRGETQKYEVDGSVAAAVYDIYEYSFSGDEIEIGAEVIPSSYYNADPAKNYYVSGTITDRNVTSGWIVVNNTRYFVDEDTYIYDFGNVDKDDPEYASLRDIDRGKDHAEIVLTDDTDKNSSVIKFLFFFQK